MQQTESTANGWEVAADAALAILEDAKLLLYLTDGPPPRANCRAESASMSGFPKPNPSITTAACSNEPLTSTRDSPEKTKNNKLKIEQNRMEFTHFYLRNKCTEKQLFNNT